MTKISISEAAKAVVRRNTEEVQGGGNFEVFEQLFADNFLDHTPQPGRTPDKNGARELYKVLRGAFPDFHAEIHWQLAGRDDLQNLSRHASGRILRHRADWPNDSIRNRRCHAGARRQDYRSLGCSQSLLAYAAARRVAGKGVTSARPAWGAVDSRSP